MKSIPERTLRNQISQVLRDVEAGEQMRITVGGRPVADLVPIHDARNFVPRERVLDILRQAPLDQAFLADLERLVGATIEEL